MYTSQQCLPAETDHNLTAAVYFPPIWHARHLSQSSSQKNTAPVTFLNTSAIIYHVLRNLQFIVVVETTRRVTHSIHYPSKDQFEFKIPKFYTEYSVKSLCELPTSSERIGKGIGNSSDSRTSPPRKAFETNECQE